ncbi:MAG: leader peptidase (prepilin peptidase)/N-methyltransferase [Polyangiales bacterium]|jgi:leader peptidase (prepilin peptidase)/N-methyltransferase
MLVTDLPPALLRSLAFVFGALWGSFFNVAIYRWPLGMSVVNPPSHCPSCHTPVPWYRNLPLIAYAMQRGRAACCGTKLTGRYLMVELLGGVLCLALMERFVLQAGPVELLQPLLEALVLFFFVGGLLVATFIDLEHTMIPDEVTLPGAALGLVSVSFRDVDAMDMAIGAGAGYLIIQITFVWGYERLFGRRGMGEGDSKLLLMIGAFCGWKGIVFALLGGCIQGIVAVVGAFVLRRDLIVGDEFADDPGPHVERSKTAASCLDGTGKATKLLKKAVAFEANAPPEEAVIGLTTKRFVTLVLLFGGLSVLSLMHLPPELAPTLAAISTTLGLSMMAIYYLNGRRAEGSHEATDEEVDEESAPEQAPRTLPKIPFGPFLALAALEWLFFGEQLFEWWLNLL